MYKSILVATDDSEPAMIAVKQAGDLAKACGATLTILTVTEQAPSFASSEIGWSVPPSVLDDIRKHNREHSHAVLQKAVAASGTTATTMSIEEARPYEGILNVARQVSADLIVMGSHGRRGLDRLILGSQAAKVVSQAEVSVLVVRP